MDSNMVCVISADGRDFQVLDEIILEVGLPKWAPTKDILAYIAGGGRLVAGFRNKDLKKLKLQIRRKDTETTVPITSVLLKK
jgi:hypothetical protein